MGSCLFTLFIYFRSSSFFLYLVSSVMNSLLQLRNCFLLQRGEFFPVLRYTTSYSFVKLFPHCTSSGATFFNLLSNWYCVLSIVWCRKLTNRCLLPVFTFLGDSNHQNSRDSSCNSSCNSSCGFLINDALILDISFSANFPGFKWLSR